MHQPALPDTRELDHGSPSAARLAEVWAKLDGVTDPELDESVVALNFVNEAVVDAADCVHVAFRLPTYWCAANFAFLMADDMRTAVGSLPWVRGVTVRLGEHMYADTINDGLAQGRSFKDTFGAEADDDLDALRRIFLVKAYQRRQKVVLDQLEAAGYTPEAVVALTVADLAELPLDADGRAAVRRYFERRTSWGPCRTMPRRFSTPSARGSIRPICRAIFATCAAWASTPNSTACSARACCRRGSTRRRPSSDGPVHRRRGGIHPPPDATRHTDRLLAGGPTDGDGAALRLHRSTRTSQPMGRPGANPRGDATGEEP